MPRTFIEVIWVRFLIWMVFILFLFVRSHEMDQSHYIHIEPWHSVECADWFPDALPCRTGADGE